MPPRDTHTLDLFREFKPKPVVERFPEERVRGATHAARIARAVSEALKECGRSRDAVAQAMSEYLGEPVSRAMLDAYASPARASHAIPAHRLLALAVVTGAAKPLINALAADAGLIAIEAGYEALIRREMAREAAERLTREAAAADAQWKAGR